MKLILYTWIMKTVCIKNIFGNAFICSTFVHGIASNKSSILQEYKTASEEMWIYDYVFGHLMLYILTHLSETTNAVHAIILQLRFVVFTLIFK